MLLLFVLLVVGAGAAVYAIEDHGADAGLAAGVAAVCVAAVILFAAGMWDDPGRDTALAQVLVSPTKILDAIGAVIGFPGVVFALAVGAFAGHLVAESTAGSGAT